MCCLHGWTYQGVLGLGELLVPPQPLLVGCLHLLALVEGGVREQQVGKIGSNRLLGMKVSTTSGISGTSGKTGTSRTSGTARRSRGTLVVSSLRSDFSFVFSALVTFTLSWTSTSSTYRTTHMNRDSNRERKVQPKLLEIECSFDTREAIMKFHAFSINTGVLRHRQVCHVNVVQAGRWASGWDSDNQWRLGRTTRLET